MSSSTPSVSVIIPAKDAAQTLPETLESVRAQDYSNLVEIIVAAADSESADAAEGARVVENPSGTTPAGLNAAIGASIGDIVVRCDAHAHLPPGYVSRAVATLLNTGAENVGGMQVPIGTTTMERVIAAAMRMPIGAGDARYRLGGEPGPVETVYLGVFRRDLLRRLGGYDEKFTRNQDYELNQRIRDSGGVVYFDPQLKVGYRPRRSIKALARQYFQYGQGKRRMARRHPGTLRWRQIAPPILLGALAASTALGFVWTGFFALPLLYLAGLMIGSIIDESGLGFAKVLLPLALSTMHLAWGLGFIRG